MLLPGHWLSALIAARLRSGFGGHGLLAATGGDVLALSQVLERRILQAGEGPYRPDHPFPEDSALSRPLFNGRASHKGRS